MTCHQMDLALQTGYNGQGRAVSQSMKAKYFKAAWDAKQAGQARREKLDYRGFVIEGATGQHWFVTGAKPWQTMYETKAKAMLAVDACMTLRESLV